MKVIFIAGPYRAASANQIDANIQRAREAAADVWQMGAAALCPHMNSAHMDGLMPDSSFLCGGREMLSRCDAVYCFNQESVRTSAGTRCEIEYANDLNIPVFFSIEDVEAWLNE